MNISEIKKTMFEKGIPLKTIEQFVFPKVETGTPEENIAFVNQMDNCLRKNRFFQLWRNKVVLKMNTPSNQSRNLKEKLLKNELKY